MSSSSAGLITGRRVCSRFSSALDTVTHCCLPASSYLQLLGLVCGVSGLSAGFYLG